MEALYFIRQKWQGIKDPDRNFISAFFHMCTVTLVCTSLVALGWFRLRGARCSPHLAVYQFFSFGNFSMVLDNDPRSMSSKFMYVSQYQTSNYGVLRCVTPEVASLMRVIILLCFLALSSALCGFLLDIYGPTRPFLQLLRRASLPSILAVLWVASIVGACFNVAEVVRKTTLHINPTYDLQVTFEYGVYTITAAGACAIAAAASNLLQLPFLSQDTQQEQDGQRLVDDWDGLETFSVGNYAYTPLDSIPPPPYTP